MEEGRHDWNINDITWDRHEMKAEWRGDRSPEQSAGASSAQAVSLLAWVHRDAELLNFLLISLILKNLPKCR